MFEKKKDYQTVLALATAVDAKNNYTHGHSRRVAKYSRLIAEISEENMKYLRESTHDLIKDIKRNGADKRKTQPEQLKHEFSGYFSRRINQKNRLAYKVEDEKP